MAHGIRETYYRRASGLAIESMPTGGFPELHYSELYDGMITPLMPYAFRGALWYQGESNALDAFRYRQLLPTMIRSWRTAAKNEFPFLIVQLPNHGAIPQEPSESAWAELREAEFQAFRKYRMSASRYDRCWRSKKYTSTSPPEYIDE